MTAYQELLNYPKEYRFFTGRERWDETESSRSADPDQNDTAEGFSDRAGRVAIADNPEDVAGQSKD